MNFGYEDFILYIFMLFMQCLDKTLIKKPLVGHSLLLMVPVLLQWIINSTCINV